MMSGDFYSKAYSNCADPEIQLLLISGEVATCSQNFSKAEKIEFNEYHGLSQAFIVIIETTFNPCGIVI